MSDDTQRGTILLVDDNVDILGLAKGLLEIAGYAVITATDGREGLRFYAEHKFHTEPRSSIVLLLTDVVMPKINGFELADRIHAMDSELPVLFMSGDAGCEYRDWECLAKPFRPDELIETVSRVLYANAQPERAASVA